MSELQSRTPAVPTPSNSDVSVVELDDLQLEAVVGGKGPVGGWGAEALSSGPVGGW
jgi:hypothetical protein